MLDHAYNFGNMRYWGAGAAAIATEARRAATTEIDAVHEGAGPKDIARTQVQSQTPHGDS